MKHIFILMMSAMFCLFLFAKVEVKNTPPNLDEVDLMLKKVESNLKMASVVTSVAKGTSEKLVTSKVAEKKELKSNLEKATQELKVVSEKVEAFSEILIKNGIDTAINIIPDEFKFAGAIYEEWLQYKKDGGDSDFEYYRLYKK